MAKFFVDANILLAFYSTAQEYQKLLAGLAQVGEDLFITEQVALEVERNKLNKAGEAFRNTLQSLKPPQCYLPVHLAGEDNGLPETHKALTELCRNLKALAKQARQQASGVLESVSHSTDPVSESLKPILDRRRKPGEGVLQRAERRRAIGLPPGKSTDPLGDQISWEQLLEVYDGVESIWIVTKDLDYYHRSKETNSNLLNPLLYNDLTQRVEEGQEVDVRVFEELGEALKDYAASSDLLQEQALARIDFQRLKEEEAHEAFALEKRRRKEKLDMLLLAGGGVAAAAALVAAAAAFSAPDEDEEELS